MNRSQLDTFEKLVGQLQSIYDEVALLSKRAPNDALNTFKLRFINKLLNAANVLLGAKYRPFDDFSKFEEDAVPQNSDVALVLAQYLQCFEKLRADNVLIRAGSWYWSLEATKREGGDEAGRLFVSTVKPKRLRD